MPECDVCGEREFQCVDGHYYCTLCHTQSQDLREEVREEIADRDEPIPFTLKAVSVAREPRARVSRSRRSVGRLRSLSRYEAFTIVLREQTKCLLAAGAPPALRELVFQLWAAYLCRRGIAFSGGAEEGPPPPRSVAELRREAAARSERYKPRGTKLSKEEAEQRLLQKVFEDEEFYSDDGDEDTDGGKASDDEDDGTEAPLRTEREGRELPPGGAERGGAELPPGAERDGAELSPGAEGDGAKLHPGAEGDGAELPPGAERDGAELHPGTERDGTEVHPGAERDGAELPPGAERDGAELPPGAEGDGAELPPGDGDSDGELPPGDGDSDGELPPGNVEHDGEAVPGGAPHSRPRKYGGRRPGIAQSPATLLRLRHTIGFLYLALLHLGLPLLLSDVLRLAAAGRLPYFRSAELLSDYDMFADDAMTFRPRSLPQRESVVVDARLLRGFLALPAPRSRPDAAHILARLQAALGLPRQLLEVARGVVVATPDLVVTDDEAHAMAAIVVTLRLVFGVDGSTERALSRRARRVNAAAGAPRAFVWDDWVRQTHARWKAMRYHLPSSGVANVMSDKCNAQAMLHAHATLRGSHQLPAGERRRGARRPFAGAPTDGTLPSPFEHALRGEASTAEEPYVPPPAAVLPPIGGDDPATDFSHASLDFLAMPPMLPRRAKPDDGSRTKLADCCLRHGECYRRVTTRKRWHSSSSDSDPSCSDDADTAPTLRVPQRTPARAVHRLSGEIDGRASSAAEDDNGGGCSGVYTCYKRAKEVKMGHWSRPWEQTPELPDALRWLLNVCSDCIGCTAATLLRHVEMIEVALIWPSGGAKGDGLTMDGVQKGLLNLALLRCPLVEHQALRNRVKKSAAAT
ncbi:PREDICTED: uncharacterized protein LOC106809254 [Priapulus caudatus]|uniref:Uncharacterized protein LOC106809254 n=1 Tax=Priapulus caudatus TaxID=37621 RepID=A0ABM1E6C6_PRICU|nr:PREDICTED: uncharacterized protein LOC106809254 [Priapulus caudatus]